MAKNLSSRPTKLVKQTTNNSTAPINTLFWDPWEFEESSLSQELKMNKMNKEYYSLLVMSIVDPKGYKQVIQERELRRQHIQDKWDARCLSRRLRAQLNNSGVTCVKTSHSKL